MERKPADLGRTATTLLSGCYVTSYPRQKTQTQKYFGHLYEFLTKFIVFIYAVNTSQSSGIIGLRRGARLLRSGVFVSLVECVSRA